MPIVVVGEVQIGAYGSANRAPEEWIPAFAGMMMAGRVMSREPSIRTSERDEAVDLAIAEQPLAVLFDHLVAIGAARADFWPLGTVLHDRPV
jgi:hypothetical protein